jgi:polysaccharide chain length determinant protein (PEP-CTERM system associated)
MEPGDFLDILRRRKWLIVFSSLIILFAALVYCVLIPDQYRSQTKILIIPPAVAEGMVRTTVNVSTRDRLQAIEQDTLSRTYLLGVINGIGISRLGLTGMPEEEMLGKMRSRIDLQIERNPERNPERSVNTFILSFLHENPNVAQEVATTLSSLFIGENIKLREAVTQETSKFLEDQLKATRVKLEQQEGRVKQYKLRFGGELPQQEQANLNRLQRLQDQIKNNSDSVARLQDRKVFMETQVGTLARNFREGDPKSADPAGSGDQLVPANLLSELFLRRKKLEEASRKYTPIHPSVVQARWEVAQMEAMIATAREEGRKVQAGSTGGAANPSSTQSISGLQQVSPEMAEVQRLRSQIAQTDLEITALKRESVIASRTIDEIQRKVERLPQREQELISLTRDYDNIKKSYDDLLSKKLKANISESLEEGQKGERFQVVEPADLPTRPSKPDRLKAIGLALLASLVIGVGGSFGLEVLDPTLRGSREFKSFFDIPILACLPVIQDDRLKRRGAVRRAAVVGGLVSLLGAYAVFLAIHGRKILSILKTIGSTIGGKS